MKLARLTLVAFACVAAVSLEARRQADPLQRQSWKVDGVERTAIVAASRGPDGAAGSPLVLIFHGHGGTAQHSARTFSIHTHWPEAIVIYAQGLPTPGRMTDPGGLKPGWQHAVGDQGDRDIKYVDAMLAWARTRFTIDTTRVYAGGHSNGGTMTYVLWAGRGDVFAALAPSASVFRRDLMSSAKPKPALIIAGQKDELVPFTAQRSSLQATLRLNQASAAGQPWSGGVVLHPSAIGADVAAYVHPGDHTMPADAGALMVKFFKAHPAR